MPGDRTEQATPHRRERARKQGDILRSRELPAAAAMLAGVLGLGVFGRKMIESFRGVFIAALDLGSPERWEPVNLRSTLESVRATAVRAIVPGCATLIMMMLAAWLIGVSQTGGLQINAGSIGVRLNRLSPIENLKNLFSLRAASRLGKSLIPAGILGFLAVQRISRELAMPPFSSVRLRTLGSDVYGLLLATAVILFAWSLIDYVVEWRSRESRLMMSREEMKEEFKEMEGNPQIRGRIRGLQRQLRRRKVKADVSKAAVVLTNPTHYAVALGFDFATMEAPVVLAKGRNLIAEEIKAEARWAGVPIVENPPLARSLYRSVDAGRPIPVELYTAVAAILAYIYRQRVEAEMREQRARRAGQEGARPATVPPGTARTSSAAGTRPVTDRARPEGEN